MKAHLKNLYARFLWWAFFLFTVASAFAQVAPQTGDTRWSQFNATAWQSVTATTPTVAALKAQAVTQLASGTPIRTLGYYAAGDGGGADFVYNSTSTAAPNNGSIVQPNAGSGRWLMNPLPYVNVRQFGAKGDGVTNDTAAVQAAVSAAVGRVIFPDGNFLLGTVNIAQGLTVEGNNGYFEGNSFATYITATSATVDIFKVNCLQPVVFRGLNFTGNPQTAGNAITFDYTGATSIANAFSKVENCVFDNMSTGVYAKAASGWNVTNCTFWNIPAAGAPNSQGVYVNNTYNVDQGDGSISGCTFSGLGFAGTGITWVAGDGLRVTNNKFLIANPLNVNLSGVAGGQFYVSGNSFDNIGAGGVGFFELTGTTTFSNIIITHNLFAGYGATSSLLTVGGIAAAHITDVTIANNQFVQSGGSITSAINTNYVDRLTLTGNRLYNTLGTGTGISIGANCTSVIVSPDNAASGFSTSISNGSAYTGLPGYFTTGTFAGLMTDGFATGTIAESIRLTNANNAADNGNYISWQAGGFGKLAAFVQARRVGGGVNFNLEFGASSDFSTTDASVVFRVTPTRTEVIGSTREVATTVSGLPSASPSGQTAMVTDATLTAIAGLGLVVTGGGSNFSPVYSDGTNWRQY